MSVPFLLWVTVLPTALEALSFLQQGSLKSMEGGAAISNGTFFHLHERAMDSSGNGDVVLFSALFSVTHHCTSAIKLREFLKGVM